MSAKKSCFLGVIAGFFLCLACVVAWVIWERQQLNSRVAFFEEWGKLKFETPSSDAPNE